MTRKFMWLTGDPAVETDVAAELAGYVKLDALLKNIGATDGHSEENRGKHFEHHYPLGKGNGALLKYKEDGTYGYHPPNEESWEDEDVMGDDPLYPGFVPAFTVREIAGEAVRDKIDDERAEKYAAHYRRRVLLEDASTKLAVAWQDLSKAIMDHSGDPHLASIEWSREPTRAYQLAQQAYTKLEQMTDEEIMAVPDLS